MCIYRFFQYKGKKKKNIYIYIYIYIYSKKGEQGLVGTDVAERSGAGVEVGEEKWRETERERGACGGRKVCGSDGVGVMDGVADVIFWVPAEVYIRFENSYLQIKN